MKRIIFLFAILLTCAASAQQLKVSILGDSYSSFRGLIPEGYDIFYPHDQVDVKEADQTWWGQLIKENGWQLEINNSYSGSTICNTGYGRADFSDRAFISRINYIGNPDILFIFGGTNDAWANSPIGEYIYSDWTKQDLFSFRPALAYLLNGLKGLYPKMKIYLLLNDGLKPEIGESMEAIGARYDVSVIKLQGIDKAIGHPTAAGMKEISRQINAFMAAEK